VVTIVATPPAGLDELTYWELTLRDSNLRVLAQVSVRGGESNSYSPRLRMAPGAYELSLTAAEAFTNQEVTVLLRFEDESEILAEREPNDSIDQATPVELNRVILGNTHSSTDIDYFLLQIPEEGILVIQLEADRSTPGFYWTISGRAEAEEDFEEILFPESQRHSDSLVVSSGMYYLRIAPLPVWSYQDYRLIARFTASPWSYSEPVALSTGSINQFPLTMEAALASFHLEVTLPDDLPARPLAFRLTDLEATDGVLALSLYLDGEQVWQLELDAPQQSYAAIIPSVAPGVYSLEFEWSGEGTEFGAMYVNFGFFLPEELPMLLELTIGSSQMMVNGEVRDVDPGFDTAPLLYDNRTMLPIRSLVEAMGGTIHWDAERDEITIFCNGHVLQLWLNSTLVLLNGEYQEMELPPLLMEGRTMLPLRFIGEALGCYVSWEQEEQRILVRN